MRIWQEEVALLSHVRLPAHERDIIAAGEERLLRATNGAEASLAMAVTLHPGLSPPVVRCKGGRRAVAVAANADPAPIFGDEVGGIPIDSALADLIAVYPNLICMSGGEQQRQLHSLDAPCRGLAIALMMMLTLRTIQARYSFHLGAMLGYGIVSVVAILAAVLPAISGINARLIALYDRSGVRTESRLRTQGGLF